MALDKGRNAGITGLCDWPGAGVKFVANLSGWALSGDVSERSRNGRGTGRWAKARRVLSSGNLALKGTVRSDGYPLPATFDGVEGSVAIKLSGAQSATVPIRVLTFKCSLSDTQQGLWDVALTARVTAMPAFAGFGGTQPTYTLPSIGDQELYEGLSKSLDPNDLLSTATQKIDVWGLGDTNSAEQDKLADLIAAAVAPLTGLKVRSAALDPGRDADGGTVTIVWGRTTTAEDVINEHASKTVDASGINSTAAVAAINGTPAAPTGDANFVKASTVTTVLNDGNTLTVDQYATRTTQQGIEQDGTPTNDDPQDLADSAEITTVTTSGTPPSVPSTPVSGTKHRETRTLQLNNGKWRHTFAYGRRTTRDEIEQDQSSAAVDPNALNNETTLTQVTSSATPPAAPSTPSGTKLVETTSRQLHDTRWRHAFRFAARDSKDDIEQPGTETSDDVGDLADAGAVTQVTSSSTPPATPASPVAGAKLVKTVTRPVGNGRYAHRFEYAARTTQDAVEQDGTSATDDANGLADQGRITVVTSSATPPAAPAAPVAGTKLVNVTTKQLGDARWSHAFDYAVRDSIDEEQFAGTRTAASADGLGDQATAVIVSDADPGAPAAPTAACKLLESAVQQITGTLFRFTYRYGPTTRQDEVEMEGTVSGDDPGDVADEATVRQVTTSGTPASPPASPLSGAVHRKTTTRQLMDGRWSHTFEYGPATATEAITFEGTVNEADPQAIGDEATVRQVTTSSTPASPPSAPISGTKHVGTVSRQLTSAGKWSHTFKYATKDAKDAIEMGGSVTVDDASDIDDEQTITKVQGSVTPTPPTAPSGLSLIDTTTKQLNAAKWAHTFRYGKLTAAERIAAGGTTSSFDPLENYANETTTVAACLATDTAAMLAAAAFAANRGTATFAGVMVQKINKTLYRTALKFKNDDKLVTSDLVTRTEKVLGIPLSGWSATPVAAQVRVARIPVLGANNVTALIQHVEVERTRGPVEILRRLLITSGADLTAALHLSDLGLVCNGGLLGFPAHSLKYSGPKIMTDLKLLGDSHLLLVKYAFEYDTYSHMNLSKLAYGWVPTASPTTYISVTGDVTATAYFAADMLISYPAESDLSWAVA